MHRSVAAYCVSDVDVTHVTFISLPPSRPPFHSVVLGLVGNNFANSDAQAKRGAVMMHTGSQINIQEV
ncbi:hypothetical protein B0H19DRAFT_1111257 [Mycena capillaripes]|nr:hypothetical protein B0H19DRAFT_1111257 [Mycena capillaripes]